MTSVSILDLRKIARTITHMAEEMISSDEDRTVIPKDNLFWYNCPICDRIIERNDNYCRGCGRKLGWN